MICKFCGKTILENSLTCPYCRKTQEQSSEAAASDSQPVAAREKTTFEKIAFGCFAVGIVGFLILYIKMAPGTGFWKIVSYILGLIILSTVAVEFYGKKSKELTKKRQVAALMIGLLLLIPSLALRVVYECKVDAAEADIPQTGTVCIQIHTEEEFYSYSFTKITRPFSEVLLDGHSGKKQNVELNKPYTIEVIAGFSGGSGSTVHPSLENDKTITFTQENLRDGYKTEETVFIRNGSSFMSEGSIYADVTIEFTRVCSFWEVVFYSPSK